MHSVLVTGGAGFIGAHLCRRLLQDGNKVICLDNLISGSLDNLRDMIADPLFSFVEADVSDAVCPDIDQIYHLACPASPAVYQQDPIQTSKTCVHGSLNMLELATRCHARILLTSTSEIYGEPLIHPQPESYRGNVNPIGIRSCYDEGKRMAESMFFDFHRHYGTDIRVARIFNTYGPGMQINDGRVISNFVVQALRNEDITVYGDGHQTRCFCYVSDTVDGLVRLMNKEGITGPINIGNPHEFTVLDTANIIMSKVNSS